MTNNVFLKLNKNLYKWWCHECLLDKTKKPSYDNSLFKDKTIEEMTFHNISKHGMRPPTGWKTEKSLKNKKKKQKKRKTKK